jgi:uncharacterized protein HemX
MNSPPADHHPSPASHGRSFHFSWGVTLGIVATLLSAGVWLDSRDQSRSAKTELARKLSEFDASVKESRLLARNADDMTRETLSRLAQVESQLANSREQQLALESLYKELSRDRDQWALADIEQIILTASQQLQLAGNLRAAIVALETADLRLQRLDKPQFSAIRLAISNDLAKLRAVPDFDQAGISMRLIAQINGIDKWPLSSSHTQTGSHGRKPKGPITHDLLAELKNLVQIRRMDQGEPALLTPEQEYFLRQNLKLRLLSARLSVLMHDENGYKSDLDASLKLLGRYFNTQDATVVSAMKELRTLAGIRVERSLPDLKESQTAVQRFKEARQ